MHKIFCIVTAEITFVTNTSSLKDSSCKKRFIVTINITFNYLSKRAAANIRMSKSGSAYGNPNIHRIYTISVGTILKYFL